MRIDVVVAIGPNKDNCDDSVLVNNRVFNNESDSLNEEIKAVFVADGVGGSPGGKDASLFLLNEIRKVDFSQFDENDIRNKLKEINLSLIESAHSIPGKEKMATTLTGILKGISGYYMVHIGNTRMYFKQGNYLKQISTDQTQYQSLLNMGRYVEAESCNKSVILGCFGGENNSYIASLVVEKIEASRLPDMILLTSDGIHDALTIEEMEKIIVSSSTVEDVRKLVDLATEKVSEDDKSVVIIRSR